jgi:PilZ domain
LAESDQAAEPGHKRRRRFPRWHFDVRIQVSVFREGVTTSLWGRTSELAEDGIGATLSGELTAGEVVGMEFPIPVAPHTMKVRAIVRYSQGLRCGFEFLVVTNEQKDTLRRTCEVLANS